MVTNSTHRATLFLLSLIECHLNLQTNRGLLESAVVELLKDKDIDINRAKRTALALGRHGIDVLPIRRLRSCLSQSTERFHSRY